MTKDKKRPMRLQLLKLELDRLAGLDDTAYEIERREVAQELEVSLAFLDRRRAALRKERGTDQPAAAVETLEPWDDEVDGAELADHIRARIAAHVVFSRPEDADAATLWIFGTYLMDGWRLFPKLLISSPVRRCGKSTLLELVEAFTCRSMVAGNTTPAALYRAIARWQPTLLLDECDTYLKANPELVGVINSGHTRRTANVLRCVEVAGRQEVEHLSVWAPMALAGIGNPADTLVDRSVRIELRRKLPHEGVARLCPDFFERMRPMRRKLLRWCGDHAEEIGASESEPPPCGNDRAQDNWAPLLRIAEALGGDWPHRALAAYGAAASADDTDGEPAGVRLLADILDVFEARGAERLPTREIVADLIAMEERPWGEWAKGRPISPHHIARLLKPLGVASQPMRVAGEVAKGFDRAALCAAHRRYCPASPPTPNGYTSYKVDIAGEKRGGNGYTKSYTGYTGAAAEAAGSDVTDAVTDRVTDQKRRKPIKNKRVTDVTDQMPPSGEKGRAEDRGVTDPWDGTGLRTRLGDQEGGECDDWK